MLAQQVSKLFHFWRKEKDLFTAVDVLKAIIYVAAAEFKAAPIIAVLIGYYNYYALARYTGRCSVRMLIGIKHDPLLKVGLHYQIRSKWLEHQEWPAAVSLERKYVIFFLLSNLHIYWFSLIYLSLQDNNLNRFQDEDRNFIANRFYYDFFTN